MPFSYQSTNSILYRMNGTNTSPSRPTRATSTSPTSTSPTSPAAAAALHPSTPPMPTPPLQTQTPITPTLNHSPNRITTTTTIIIQRSSSSSHQISPTCPSAQCPSSPRLPSTQIRTRIDYPRGIHVESRRVHVRTGWKSQDDRFKHREAREGRINQSPHRDQREEGVSNKSL